MNILFIPATGMGDAVIATPMIRALKLQYPNSFLCVLSGSRQGRMLLKNNPFIDKLINYKIYNKNPITFIKTVKKIKREFTKGKVDLFVARGGAFSNVLGIYLKAPVRAGLSSPTFKHKLFDLLLTDIVKFNPRRHIVNDYELLAKKIGIKKFNSKTEVYCHKDNSAIVDALYGSTKINDAKYNILFHNGSDMEGKRWDNQKFSYLADRINGLVEESLNIILVGAQKDRNYSETIKKKSNSTNIHNLCGLTSIQETIALINKSDIIISIDSGIAHISAALNKPTIVLWGPTILNKSKPIGNKVYIVKEYCKFSPCYKLGSGKLNCINEKEYACMNRIQSNHVMKIFTKFWEKYINKQ